MMMITKKKIALVAALLTFSGGSAFATCTGPAVMHDFPGTSFNMSLATNSGDGNCASNVVVIGPSIPNFTSAQAVTGTFWQTTQPVSLTSTTITGTVAVTQSTSPWVVSNGGTFATQSAITAASASIASGAYASGSIGSGAMVDLGAIADAASTAGGTGTLSAKMRLMTTQLGTINTTLGSPFQAGGSIGNTTFAVTNIGTFAVQATLQPSATTAIGKVDPNTIGTWGLSVSTQNTAAPTNMALISCQFNTSPTTITTTNTSALQCDNAGAAIVTVKNTNANITPGDGISTATYTVASPTIGVGLLWNGTTYDRAKSAGSTGIAAVGGAGASGSAVVGNPNLVAGSDGINAQTIATDTGGNQKVINGASKYQLVAASATATALTGGGGGATGDYLSHCDIFPATTSPGVVTILDNTTAVYSFPGGASSVSNLVPFPIPVGSLSGSGAWKITTGANVSVVCTGKFT